MKLSFLTPVVLLMALLSCNEEPTTIGSDFFQDGNLDIVYVDSFTVKASTMAFDKLITSDVSRFLVGYHGDADAGKLYVSAFFQIAPDGSLSLDEDFTTYSRTTIVLVPDGYSFYDTTTRVSLSVHELVQEIEAEEDGYLYNNTSDFEFDDEPMGSLSFLPKPNSSDTLEIPLDDSFGRKIFTLAQQDAYDVSTPSAFVDAFQGIVLMPGTSSSGPILGFGLSPEVRIYYWDRSQTPSQEKYLSIRGGQHLKFNRIVHDRTGSGLSLIPNQEEYLSSDLTNHIGFIQGGTGLALRLDIPYLKDLLFENKNLMITGAVLEFYPLRDGERNTTLPENLVMSIVNYKNELYQTEALSVSLIKDEYLDRDTRYQVDIGSFVMQQLKTEELNKNALLLTLDDGAFRSSVNMVRIGDQKSENKMKLKLYCVVLKN